MAEYQVRIPTVVQTAENLLNQGITEFAALQGIGLALVGISTQLAEVLAIAIKEDEEHAEWMASRQP